jgi:hypothetical protein
LNEKNIRKKNGTETSNVGIVKNPRKKGKANPKPLIKDEIVFAFKLNIFNEYIKDNRSEKIVIVI